jgi:hypothetical protein
MGQYTLFFRQASHARLTRWREGCLLVLLGCSFSIEGELAVLAEEELENDMARWENEREMSITITMAGWDGVPGWEW